MIRIQHLRKVFLPETVALHDITLEVPDGDFLVMIGSSGAGKSTLLRCLNRLIEPTAGEIFLDALNVTRASRQELRAIRRNIGMIFQQFNLIRRLSVLENVLVGRLGYTSHVGSLFGYFSAQDRRIALECLDQVGLADFALRRADTLSGGEQQRVGIARALAQSPQVILADEPTASLDPHLAHSIMDILKRINEERHITLIVSLHLLNLALDYGQHILGLQRGKVVYSGKKEGLSPEIISAIYGVVDAEKG
jgi:phosphonate transport system ATP-binding protein